MQFHLFRQSGFYRLSAMIQVLGGVSVEVVNVFLESHTEIGSGHRREFRGVEALLDWCHGQMSTDMDIVMLP